MRISRTLKAGVANAESVDEVALHKSAVDGGDAGEGAAALWPQFTTCHPGRARCRLAAFAWRRRSEGGGKEEFVIGKDGDDDQRRHDAGRDDRGDYLQKRPKWSCAVHGGGLLDLDRHSAQEGRQQPEGDRHVGEAIDEDVSPSLRLYLRMVTFPSLGCKSCGVSFCSAALGGGSVSGGHIRS